MLFKGNGPTSISGQGKRLQLRDIATANLSLGQFGKMLGMGVIEAQGWLAARGIFV